MFQAFYNFCLDMERQVLDMKDIANQKPKIQDFGQISITLQDPIFCQKDTFKYFLYPIVGKDKDGPYSIKRRYSDFDLLRKKLCQRWLGIYIPPISGKRAENNPLYILKIFDSNSNQEKYASTRKKFLKYFCEGIAIRPYLYNCDLFQLFIRGSPDYEAAISSCIIKEYSSLLKAYQLSFDNLLVLNQTHLFEEIIEINEKHLASLRQSESNLQSICEKIFKATEAREEFNIQFNQSMKKTIPDYEQKFLLSHVGKTRERLILNKNEEFAAKLLQFEKINAINPFQKFLQMIMYEIRQVKAFIQAIEGRKQAEKRKIELKQKIAENQNQKNKLMSGSFSFKALFKSGSKELQANELTMKIQILKNELLCIEKMIVIMVMNTNFEIVEYRNRRSKEYIQIFRSVAQLEVVQLEAYLQLTNIPLAVLQ